MYEDVNKRSHFHDRVKDLKIEKFYSTEFQIRSDTRINVEN